MDTRRAGSRTRRPRPGATTRSRSRLAGLAALALCLSLLCALLWNSRTLSDDARARDALLLRADAIAVPRSAAVVDLHRRQEDEEEQPAAENGQAKAEELAQRLDDVLAKQKDLESLVTELQGELDTLQGGKPKATEGKGDAKKKDKKAASKPQSDDESGPDESGEQEESSQDSDAGQDTSDGTETADNEAPEESSGSDTESVPPESAESETEGSEPEKKEEEEEPSSEPSSSSDSEQSDTDASSSGDSEASAPESESTESEPAAETPEASQESDSGGSEDETSSGTDEQEAEPPSNDDDSSSSGAQENESAATEPESSEDSSAGEGGEDSSSSQDNEGASSSDTDSGQESSSGDDDSSSSSKDESAEPESEPAAEAGGESGDEGGDSQQDNSEPSSNEESAGDSDSNGDDDSSASADKEEKSEPESTDESTSSSGDDDSSSSTESNEAEQPEAPTDEESQSNSTDDSEKEAAESDSQAESSESEPDSSSEEEKEAPEETQGDEGGDTSSNEYDSTPDEASESQDSESTPEDSGETSEEPEKEEAEEKSVDNEETQQSDESDGDSSDQSEESSSDSQDSEETDSEDKGSDEEQAASEEKGEGDDDSESKSDDAGDNNEETPEAGGDDTEASGEEKEGDSEEGEAQEEEQSAEEGEESTDDGDSDEAGSDETENTPEEGESEEKKAPEDEESSEESSGDEGGDESEAEDGEEAGGDEEGADSEAEAGEEGEEGEAAGDEEGGDSEAADEGEENENEGSEGEESEAEETTSGDPTALLATTLGLEKDALAAFRSAAKAAKVQVAHCTNVDSDLAGLSPDEKAAVKSACGSSVSDATTEEAVPGAVFVVQDLSKFKEVSSKLPEELGAALDCASQPIRDVSSDPKIKIIMAIGPAGGAEASEGESGDGEGEEGEQGGEEGAEDSEEGGEEGDEAGGDDAGDDGESEGEAEERRRLKALRPRRRSPPQGRHLGRRRPLRKALKRRQLAIAAVCPDGPGDIGRRLAVRVSGLKLGFKAANVLIKMFLGPLPITIPDIFGKLPDIATLSQVALDYAALPDIASARVILKVRDLTLAPKFGLVNISATLNFDAEAGPKLELGGSAVVPFYPKGIGFSVSLLTDGDMIPLRLGVGTNMLSIKSLLNTMKADQVISQLEKVPVLGKGVEALLSTQVKDIAFSFCKPGTKDAGCQDRFSLRALLPPNLFHSDQVPISLDNPTIIFAVLNPFSADRSVDLRLEGMWTVSGTSLPVSFGKPSDMGLIDVSSDFVDQNDATAVEEAATRRRLAKRAWAVVDLEEAAAQPKFEVYEQEPEYIFQPDFDVDRWSTYPELYSVQAFGFYDVPLAHLNHHAYRLHRAKRRDLNVTNDLVDQATANHHRLEPRQRKLAPRKAATGGKAGASAPAGGATGTKTAVVVPGSNMPASAKGKWTFSIVAEKFNPLLALAQLGASILPGGDGVAKLLDKLNLRNLELENFNFLIVLGKDEVILRVGGSAAILPGAQMQVIAGKQGGAGFGGALALAVRGDAFTTLIHKIVPSFKMPDGLDLVASGTTLGLIVSSQNYELSGSPMAFGPPLGHLTSIARGFTMNLRMGLPPDCQGKQFCEVMVKLLGKDAALQIGMVINPPDITFSAAVTDIKLKEGLYLNAAGFSASVGPSPSLMLFGSLSINVDKSQPPLILEAHIGVKGPSVVLGATLTGIWRKAMGWDRLNIGNIVIEIGISATLGLPAMLIGGEVAIGKNCYTSDNKFDLNSPCIGGAVYVSINPSNPGSNWFGGELNNLDLKHIISAFTDIKPDPKKIPQPILNSGFPGKTIVSFCPMGGCVAPGHEYPMGFYLKGTLNILDVTCKAEISVNPGTGIRIKGELSPLKLADGLIIAYYSKTEQKKGPMIDLNLEYANPAEIRLELHAYVKVLIFEVDAQISLSPMHYQIQFSTNFFMFRASIMFKASIGARLDFAFSASFDMSTFTKFIDDVVAQVSAWAKEGAAKVDGAKKDVANKREDLEKAKANACDWKAKCTAAADKVKCGRKRLRLRSGRWDESDFWEDGWVGTSMDPYSPESFRLQKRLGKLKSAFKKMGSAIKSGFEKAGSEIKKGFEKVGKAIKSVAEEAWDKIKSGVCKGWNEVSGFIVNGACQAACTVAQGAIDIATTAMKGAEAVLSGVSAGLKAAATVVSWVGDKIKSMLNIQEASIAANLDADFKAGMVSGSVAVRLKGIIFGANIDVSFKFNFGNIIQTAIDFFKKHVKELAEKIGSIFHLAGRDLIESDVEFLADGHFRFKKRALLDNFETILFDSRVMTLDEGIHLHKEQIRKRMLRLKRLRAREAEPEVAMGDSKSSSKDSSDSAKSNSSSLGDASDVGRGIKASQLPVIPSLLAGYDPGPMPGTPGGEDNDFRIKFGEDRYVSCGTTVGSFSREGPVCRLRKKVHSTIFMSQAEAKGQSFRTTGGLCLGVNTFSSVVLTPCHKDLPNGGWHYNNVTSQLSAMGLGVATARDFATPIKVEDVTMASAASDGKCLTATKSGKLRIAKCFDPAQGDKAADLAAQKFVMRINAESINLDDLITFHSTGLVTEEYLSTDPEKDTIIMVNGTISEQQKDKAAAFKVIAPICGANYHYTLESLSKPGYYLTLDSQKNETNNNLILVTKPKNPQDACWLPTPGPTRIDFASGCPGITFSLRSRSRTGFFIRASRDGRDIYASDEPDPVLLTCWRPVPPEGAPSAAIPQPTAEDLDTADEGALTGVAGLAEDAEQNEGMFGDEK